MKLLGIETTTRQLSVALWQDNEIISRHADSVSGGSLLILPWVEELLAEAQLSINALDGIAYGQGPGSFTGLRLACGVVQGLAFGLDIPVIGITSLHAIAYAAYNTYAAERVFACIDARMDEVYCAAYTRQQGLFTEILPPHVAPPEAVQFIAANGWTGCGDGFAHYADRLPQFNATYADVFPDAKSVLHLAMPGFCRGEGRSPLYAQPLYVRDKVALTTAERLARGGVR